MCFSGCNLNCLVLVFLSLQILIVAQRSFLTFDDFFGGVGWRPRPTQGCRADGNDGAVLCLRILLSSCEFKHAGTSVSICSKMQAGDKVLVGDEGSPFLQSCDLADV